MPLMVITYSVDHWFDLIDALCRSRQVQAVALANRIHAELDTLPEEESTMTLIIATTTERQLIKAELDAAQQDPAAWQPVHACSKCLGKGFHRLTDRRGSTAYVACDCPDTIIQRQPA